MEKVLAINTHPNLNGNHTRGDTNASFANSIIMRYLSKESHITVHNLIEKYPDQKINIENEQRLLVTHDKILLIGPIYWYSLPALAKLWIDEVLLYGWAYGSTGHALKGKRIQLVLTSGSSIAEYNKDDIGNTIEELFISYQKSFEYCQMVWLPIKFIGGINSQTKNNNTDTLSKSLEFFAKSLV